MNMAGAKIACTGTFGILNATQVADEPFVSMGTMYTAGTDLAVHRHTVAQGAYRKLVFNRNGTRLVEAVFIGNIHNAGLYRYVIREKMSIGTVKGLIIGHRLHYGHLMIPG